MRTRGRKPVRKEVCIPSSVSSFLLDHIGPKAFTILIMRSYTFVHYSLGSLASIENLNDPQNQQILRGHDMQVCAIAVSVSGKYIATGQIGTKNFKGNSAPVFLWQASNGRRLLVLRGLTVRVNIVAFSTDERLLCGCGEDSLLYIWDLTTGEVIYGQRLPTVVAVLQWVEHKLENRRIVYEMVLGVGSNLNKATLVYDPVRVQWSLKQQAFTVPPGGGIVRYFNCIDVSSDGVFVVRTSDFHMLFPCFKSFSSDLHM